ncbi:MAG: hypothetical protein F6J86_42540 [Symploca sp. SIO1B1]|nr:hypothetical protein [Symploca sp. SIO1B1]
MEFGIQFFPDVSPEHKSGKQYFEEALYWRALPNPEKDQEQLEQWWNVNSVDWVWQLRSMMIEHCDFGYYSQFSDQQKELLEQYYDANKLLVDCLNSECYMSKEVRQEIEDTLLLPAAD